MINTVTFDGNLTRDPELKTISTGASVCEFTVANNHRYKSKDELKDEVSFIGVVAWGKTAETCHKFLTKGSHVLIHGRLKQDRWEDKEGRQQSKTKVLADAVLFINHKPKDEDGPQS